MKNERGIALIVVLWIMAILTLLLYAFLMEMQSEVALSDGYVRKVQPEARLIDASIRENAAQKCCARLA